MASGSLKVLVFPSGVQAVQQIGQLFSERGDRVYFADTPDSGRALLTRLVPDLVVADLHAVDNGWNRLLDSITARFPEMAVIFASDYPDPTLETDLVQQYPWSRFFHPPYTPNRLEELLDVLGEDQIIPPAILPKVRFPVRIKITLPYVVLALILAVAAAYVASRVLLDTIEERFTNQLIEAGKMASDWMVQEEERRLETIRLIANTREVPEAVTAGDAEKLREIILPIAVNSQEEAVEILDKTGVAVLSLRHRAGGRLEEYESSRGEVIFGQLDFVQNVLAGRTDLGRDKYAGLTRLPWGDFLYIAAPIKNDDGQLVGAVMVGKSLDTLVRQIRQDTLAHVSLYDFNGRPLASTFVVQQDNLLAVSPELVADVLARQDQESLRRRMEVASIKYSELMGPWEVRKVALADELHDTDLGVLGVALAETFLARPSQITRLQVFLLTVVAFLLVIALGVYLANRITHPLLRVVEASSKVAEGNLDVQVQPEGSDEIAVLAHSFNYMVSGLREGNVYRDLLGRTVSPEVREELRRSFARGEIKLQGQEAVATVLMSDIQRFTTLSEAEDPTTIMSWLNEYFGEIVPVITRHGGVISKFEGDAALAFFGILPRLLPPDESAYQACEAALEMLDAVERLNERRQRRGDPPLITGIGINTGPVTAGGLGSEDRVQYTIIGDTVNTTARLEGLTRQFGETSSAVISQHTLFALRDKRHAFVLESLGVHNVKGKEEQLLVYRLAGRKETATQSSTLSAAEPA